jgi:hypothetical protein
MSKKQQRQTFNEMTAALSRASRIPPAEVPDKPVVFSFKHLDDGNTRFGMAQHQDRVAYTDVLVTRLKEICCLTLNEFIRPLNNKSLRSHQIDFDETSEPSGFPILSQLWKDRPWQFSLTSNEYGRVHGFLVANTFYVVWFDPMHALYDR